MFAKSIIDSDAFLDMPLSTQSLYFHLSMRADDEGFVGNPKKIARMLGASEDDMKILISKRFILIFDSGIVAIKHWKINNYIQADRFKPSNYFEEKSMLMLDEKNSYTEKPAEGVLTLDKRTPKKMTLARQKRLQAKKESSLPNCFDYKIRNAFLGKECPICKCIMNFEIKPNNPTIQHNIPISLGGKHEIDNISVVCQSCNMKIKNNKVTPAYNTLEVEKIWSEIRDVSGMYTQVSIGKVSIELGKDNTTTITNNNNLSFLETEDGALFVKVCKAFAEIGGTSNPDDFIAYNEARDWKGIGGEDVRENLVRYAKRWENGEESRNMIIQKG